MLRASKLRAPRVAFGLFFSLFFLSAPLRSRRALSKLYGKSSSLHGQLSLEVDDEGVQFNAKTFSSHLTWDHFGRFLEDDKVFVLYQKNDRTFNSLPKRFLSAEQTAEFRQYLNAYLAYLQTEKSRYQQRAAS